MRTGFAAFSESRQQRAAAGALAVDHLLSVGLQAWRESSLYKALIDGSVPVGAIRGKGKPGFCGPGFFIMPSAPAYGVHSSWQHVCFISAVFCRKP